MTQEEIIRMMKEAGFYIGKGDDFDPAWERFAALVAAHEREKQAEQEPVRKRCKRCNDTGLVSDGEIDNIGGAQLEVPIECVKDCPDCAAPVRTKDLTDEEIEAIVDSVGAHEVGCWQHVFARAVIAADRELNK